jgi:hypothetical protein
MYSTAKLNRRRKEILDQLAELGPLRKGSLTEQYVETTLKDGSKRRRGPYTVYTFKENNRTVSKRLTQSSQVQRYRSQIAAFRSFQELTRELAQVSQALADSEAMEEGGKKNSRR